MVRWSGGQTSLEKPGGSGQVKFMSRRVTGCRPPLRAMPRRRHTPSWRQQGGGRVDSRRYSSTGFIDVRITHSRVKPRLSISAISAGTFEQSLEFTPVPHLSSITGRLPPTPYRYPSSRVRKKKVEITRERRPLSRLFYVSFPISSPKRRAAASRNQHLRRLWGT